MTRLSDEQLAAVRERDKRFTDPFTQGARDRRALLAHVDALAAQLAGLDEDYGIFLQGTAKDAMRIRELESQLQAMRTALELHRAELRNRHDPECTGVMYPDQECDCGITDFLDRAALEPGKSVQQEGGER